MITQCKLFDQTLKWYLAHFTSFVFFNGATWFILLLQGYVAISYITTSVFNSSVTVCFLLSGVYWPFSFSSILVSLTLLGLTLYLYNNWTYHPWINLNLILYQVTNITQSIVREAPFGMLLGLFGHCPNNNWGKHSNRRFP